MKKFLLIALVLVAALGVASCNSGGGGGLIGQIAGGSGYLGGTWSGTLVSRGVYGTMSLTITISQNELGDIIGTAKITGKFSDSKGIVAGTVSNASGPGDIAFSISWGTGDTMTFIGTYTATTMKGAYSSLTIGDAGSFSLAK